MFLLSLCQVALADRLISVTLQEAQVFRYRSVRIPGHLPQVIMRVQEPAYPP